MLCAFTNENDLRQCLSAVHTALDSDLSEVLVFQARHRSAHTERERKSEEEAQEEDAEDEEEVLYGLSLRSAEKVRLLRDWRGMRELRLSFPAVDPALLQAVWTHQHSWQACFDVLGSLLRSHGRVLVEDLSSPSLSLEEHFPQLALSLSVSPPRPLSHAHRDRDRDRDTHTDAEARERGSSGEWSVVSLCASLSSLSLDGESESVRERDSERDSESDWQLVPHASSPSPPLSQSHAAHAAVKAAKTSYKDMLLRNADAASLSLALVANERELERQRSWQRYAERQRDWRPVFVLAKVSRKQETAEQPPLMDDEESDLYWDLCTDSKFAASVGRRVVKLTPAQLTQKLKRISVKTS